LAGAWLTLRGCAAWAHDHDPDRAATALFEPLPGASFVVNGARGDPDAALVSAGGEMKRLSGFSLAATFSGNTTSYSRMLVARTRGELGCRGNWLAGVWLVGVGRSFLTFSLTEPPKDNSMTSSNAIYLLDAGLNCSYKLLREYPMG